MPLSRKNQRKLNRLRRDAERLWTQQQAVFGKARELAGRAGDEARHYADKEIVPAVRKAVDREILPAFERGVYQGRRVLANVGDRVQHQVLPAVAQAGGSVTGAVREFVDNNQTLHNLQGQAQEFSKRASKDVAKFQKQLDKKLAKAKKREKSGPGVGGWFLIGAGVAAIAAVGYALWQTFRADDDLWIADEELDAPVKTVTAE